MNYAEVEKVTTENFKHQFNMKCIPDSCSGLCSVDGVVLFVVIEKMLQDKLSDLYVRKLNQNEPNNRTTKDLYLEAVNDICNSRGYNKTNKLSVWNESEEAANKKKEIHHFEYVIKKEALSVRKDLDKIIELLHKELHNNFEFDHRYIGSSSRNMITRDTKGNTGYDFDDISVKLDRIKMKDYTNKIRDCYLELKNKNFCEDKHSRSIFAEAVNNICHENGYKKHK